MLLLVDMDVLSQNVDSDVSAGQIVIVDTDAVVCSVIVMSLVNLFLFIILVHVAYLNVGLSRNNNVCHLIYWVHVSNDKFQTFLCLH